ncbi:ATP-binding cassette domain-containing protein [Companilactobacillus mishanensis]|uniref:ATP-binding cassette domain-containing protein n=1 Tax=Companilactobacillus mishanensis TaxID=2486008 RepID=UPI001297EC0D|nr:ATP-binding cassette domain-containing protein [Companilactobacillus mishanensis]MQS88907.1 ATP-binding cassette domain-containing protein [Companilactobacillus mishanensis]
MTNENAIEIKNLTKKFGDNIAVNDISFDVKPGEVFGLLGPNGAGKTTTLRMITTLLKQDSGTIRIFGHDTAKEGKDARSMFGLTGQYASVDEDITARENLMIFSRLNGLTRTESKKRTEELLKEFSLENSADKNLKDFSGGMRRRLDLAVSLITRPALIFLDEPTTGLDPRTRLQMWDTIRELVKQGSTIILTTQYLDEADQLADRIAVIDHGKLVKIGTPEELKQCVGGTKLKFVVDDDGKIQEVENMLNKQFSLNPKVTDNKVDLILNKKNQLVAVLNALDEDNISTSHLVVEEPSLDDVFMSLTVGKN